MTTGFKWVEVTEDRYDEMLGVLPPAIMTGNGFLVGEAWDHNEHGIPRYSAFIARDNKFFECLQPMTCKEFRAVQPHNVEG